MEDAAILTMNEVADYLRVSHRTVSNWAQNGEIPCGKLGGSWRFRKSDIDRWLDGKFAQERGQGQSNAPMATETLAPERVLFLESPTKKEVLTSLIGCLAETPHISRGELASAVFHREELMSTGIGLGIAIPHVRLPGLTQIVSAAAVSKEGIGDYESLDGQLVQIVFLIVAGSGDHTDYLRVLSGLAARLKDADMRRRLLDTTDPERFLSVLALGD